MTNTCAPQEQRRSVRASGRVWSVTASFGQTRWLMCESWRCRFVMGRGCWARDAAQSQRGRDWRSRQNDRRFDTSSPSASPHGDQQLAECMFMLLLFRLAATVNRFHAAWPCRAIGGPLSLFPRRCRGFCKLASLVFFDSAIATLIRRCSHQRRQRGGKICLKSCVQRLEGF